MTKSPGSRDPRGRRPRRRKALPAIDDSIKLWVPMRKGYEVGMFECPPGREEVEARYERRRSGPREDESVELGGCGDGDG